VIAVQGPKSREILAPFVDDIDLSSESFPHMAVRSGRICGVPTRLFRVSFTGELGFEVNVPSDYAQLVWEALYAHGEGFGITPYGTEAMHVLRAERGFVIVGQETDGTVTPDDLGLSGMIAKTKKDFVGKRSLARPDLVAPGRKQLVGLLTETPTVLLDEGAQVVADPNAPLPAKMLGHVTSSYWSDACGRAIAMALVEDGRALKDRTLHVTTPSGFAAARVTDPIFFDAKGERVNA
jgi:sarcosine oxidase, subunit alpha